MAGPENKTYSIRKGGVIYAQSDEPNCGYSREILRGMAAAGYFLYRNGKRVPKQGA